MTQPAGPEASVLRGHVVIASKEEEGACERVMSEQREGCRTPPKKLIALAAATVALASRTEPTSPPPPPLMVPTCKTHNILT